MLKGKAETNDGSNDHIGAKLTVTKLRLVCVYAKFTKDVKKYFASLKYDEEYFS